MSVGRGYELLVLAVLRRYMYHLVWYLTLHTPVTMAGIPSNWSTVVVLVMVGWTSWDTGLYLIPESM